MRNLRTEDEIIANWKGDIDKPVVSICCITYNHEPYIEDALEGFLIQETDFPFEILIHDDASTDRTADIICEYQAKYPRLIKPIYQTENQYSKGIKMNPTFNFPRAKGEYIALCEGDDYWISLDKLQLQFDFCSQGRYSVVYHSATEIHLNTNQRKTVSQYSDNNSKVKLIDSVKGRGAFMPTPSLFFPSALIADKLDWFDETFPIGDFFLQMILSYSGEIFYINKPMCVYRRNSIGSWTESQASTGNAIKYHCGMLKGILSLQHRLRVSSSGEIDLLSYPYFFYAKGCALSKSGKIPGLIKLFKLVPVKNVPLMFTLRYIVQFFKFLFSVLVKKMSFK